MTQCTYDTVHKYGTVHTYDTVHNMTQCTYDTVPKYDTEYTYDTLHSMTQGTIVTRCTHMTQYTMWHCAHIWHSTQCDTVYTYDTVYNVTLCTHMTQCTNMAQLTHNKLLWHSAHIIDLRRFKAFCPDNKLLDVDLDVDVRWQCGLKLLKLITYHYIVFEIKILNDIPFIECVTRLCKHLCFFRWLLCLQIPFSTVLSMHTATISKMINLYLESDCSRVKLLKYSCWQTPRRLAAWYA